MDNNFKSYQKLVNNLLAGEEVSYNFDDKQVIFALAEKVNKKVLTKMLNSCAQLQLITTDVFRQKKNITSSVIPWGTENIDKVIKSLLAGNIGSLATVGEDEQSFLITLEEKLLPRLNHWQANLLEFIANFSKNPLILVGKPLQEIIIDNIMTKDEFFFYRSYNKTLLLEATKTKISLLQGEFELYSFYSQLDQHYHWAFVKNSDNKKKFLVRIESECLTGHVLGSLLCDCSCQLKQGLESINNYGRGALIYLRQEGRGIGLHAKLKAYYMQQAHQMDTVDANIAVGVPEEARDYIIGAQILFHLGLKECKLLTNNPKKIKGLEKYGIVIDEQISHVIPAGEHNRKYLETKRDRMGHLMGDGLS